MLTNHQILYNSMVNPHFQRDSMDPLNLYEDLFAPLCGNNPIKGLITPLHQYQRTAVARMLHQELYPQGYSPILGELPMGTYSPELQSQRIVCPHRCVRMRGGILVGEPHTGKILECLALIMLTKDQVACPTALNVPFTIPMCSLTYQRYLYHSLSSRYHYTDRHTQSDNKVENRNGSLGASVVDGSMEFEPYDKVLSCLLRNVIVASLWYLVLRQILHQPDLTEKARKALLPPDLKALLYIAGPSYAEKPAFTTAYSNALAQPFTGIVKHHQENMVYFTDSTPDISKFKSSLATIPSQGLGSTAPRKSIKYLSVLQDVSLITHHSKSRYLDCFG
ncbi:hypothetical protein IWQ62_003957 [Dispira parvispora]|uniref:Uncharacterized protein n=1 Tax=Dispira parvispora TaxID=1520584 RepID=A0A9W8E2F9_9FUNG|nr:hypothetical protein IWQ62_003957 [Dispira parvispora]